VNKPREISAAAHTRSFCSLQRWTYRFLVRANLSIRRVTRTVSISDELLRNRLTSFLEQVSGIFSRNPAIVWINMDQTGVQYEMFPRSTIELVGGRSVPIKTGGNTTERVTIAVTITSQGEKLPLMAIFKGSPTGRIRREFSSHLNYPSTITYAVQRCAWMDEQLMLMWIDR
jgi:hypothetical protein